MRRAIPCRGALQEGQAATHDLYLEFGSKQQSASMAGTRHTPLTRNRPPGALAREPPSGRRPDRRRHRSAGRLDRPYRQTVDSIIRDALATKFAWNRLAALTDTFGPRLTGTPNLSRSSSGPRPR